MVCCVDGLCSILAFVIFVYIILPISKILYTHLIKVRYCSIFKDLIKKGKWALVTGATDGIGKCYCELLAKEGFDILLVSRTLAKLQATASELQTKHGIKTDIFVADFTKTDFYDKMEEYIKDLDIGVLVNNVGMFYDGPDYFISDRYPKEFNRNMINCNVMS